MPRQTPTESDGLVGVKGTAEGATFTQAELTELLQLATAAGADINAAQRAALSKG